MGKATFSKGFQKKCADEGRSAVLAKIETPRTVIEGEMSIDENLGGNLWRFIVALCSSGDPAQAFSRAFVGIELKSEFLSFKEPVQHTIEGVTISPSDWAELTGFTTTQPIRLLRLPDDLRKDDADAMKIGKAVRALQALGRQYGTNIHITLDGDDIDVSNGHGEMIAFAKEHDFEFDEDALMFEHVAEMAAKAFKS